MNALAMPTGFWELKYLRGIDSFSSPKGLFSSTYVHSFFRVNSKFLSLLLATVTAYFVLPIMYFCTGRISLTGSTFFFTIYSIFLIYSNSSIFLSKMRSLSLAALLMNSGQESNMHFMW